jgi:fluoroquinolone transport system permease protein
MNRLVATLKTDVQIQYRNGFYWISLVLMAFWLVLLFSLKDTGRIDMQPVLVLIAATNMAMTTFYFVAGLILLEKAEGTLQTLTTTPLRPLEYLLSKTITLSVLASLETGLVIILIYDGQFNPVPLVLGILYLSLLYTLLGFIAVARHDVINSFIPMSILWITVLFAPLVDFLGLYRTPYVAFHPLEPGLTLIEASFVENAALGIWTWVGIVVWLVATGFWARFSFKQQIRRRAI